MKAKLYSCYGREIYVAAKSGGVDPDGNMALDNPKRTFSDMRQAFTKSKTAPI